MKLIFTILLLTIVFFISIIFEATFNIDEHDYAVIASVGKPVKVISSKGRYFKIPYKQDVIKIPKSLIRTEDSFQCPTKDGTYVDVKSKTQWKIIDPIKYLDFFPSLDEAKFAAAVSARSELFKIFEETHIEKIKECPEISFDNYCDLEIHYTDITQKINYVLNQSGIAVAHVGIKVKLSPPNTKKIILKRP